ncbi:MAG: sugar transferase [Oscillospiraceae bacterium]|nr:sugar transferase [Oscillospiraceae bacterium]
MTVKLNLLAKRMTDIIGSLIGIIILSPFFLIVSIVIKSTSSGPVFFKQNRLGKDGRTFSIIKFRTMIPNAESIGGLKLAGAHDGRITKTGGFLRNTSIDELPQLINVLKGDMSLVGPRPPATYHPYKEYDGYPNWAAGRFRMRPGITGLAQINVRNNLPWDDRIKIDIEYINDFSYLLDIRILFKTMANILKCKYIYEEQPVEVQ